MTDDQTIQDGQRVAAFLADPAVKQAFEALHTKHFQAFKKPMTPNELLALHAEVKALDALQLQLSVVVDSGTRVLADKLRRDDRARHGILPKR